MVLRGVIDRDASFSHRLFQVSQAWRIGDIRAHARQNHIEWIVQAFQYFGQRRVQRLHQFTRLRICIAAILPLAPYCDTAVERVFSRADELAAIRHQVCENRAMTLIATLPMYNITPALALEWREWLADVLRMINPACRIVAPDEELHDLWRRPNLLISQTCGYPLTHGLQEHVQLIATPRFAAPGCEGTDYSSVLVTRKDAPFDTLAACRGARAAYNQDDSNSGMNMFRHAVAPLARAGAFFSTVVRTGSHLGSLKAVIEDRVDVAAIDCVTFAFVCDELPELAQQVRQIGMTATAPGLPLIASRAVPPATIEALRKALNEALALRPERAKRLRLQGFSTIPVADYRRIDRLENEARGLGYAHLA
jgi:ABC-type phosphate/phosphonate transport system substrate-binding protein